MTKHEETWTRDRSRRYERTNNERNAPAITCQLDQGSCLKHARERDGQVEVVAVLPLEVVVDVGNGVRGGRERGAQLHVRDVVHRVRAVVGARDHVREREVVRVVALAVRRRAVLTIHLFLAFGHPVNVPGVLREVIDHHLVLEEPV
eukprot:CAMPEP_0182582000 /NCGR_PEP_ID=MMETSP1324-20130603/51466_1 /TAXON_ID=236786 /ORGANISM="Florenciella sp., Strain RCC1587" /LENGTH=146 /DNA_ID=CAMNT_0024798421 /DNA_START=57 /DNA_END=497 /DNA_ORIENTATION=+